MNVAGSPVQGGNAAFQDLFKQWNEHDRKEVEASDTLPSYAADPFAPATDDPFAVDNEEAAASNGFPNSFDGLCSISTLHSL